MAVKTKTQIKQFFQTGDIPTESEYSDFIDSTIFLNGENNGNIQLNGSITASGDISASGDLYVGGHITASGNISSSGDIMTSQNLIAIGNISGSSTSTISGQQLTIDRDIFTLNISASGESILTHATASSISASGTIYGTTGSYNSIVLNGNMSSSISSQIKAGTGSFGVLSGLSPMTVEDNILFESPITASSNISASGTLIGEELSIGGTTLSTTTTELNYLSGLTSAEATQVKNIDTSTISTTQWGYVGAMDQGLSTADTVTFGAITISKTTSTDGAFGGTINTGGFKSFTVTINSIPNLSGKSSGEIAEVDTTENTTVTNSAVAESSVVIGVCADYELGVVCSNVQNGTFKITLTNQNTENFEAGEATFNFLII